MPFVPPWSAHTLPGRGKLVLSSFDLVDLLEDELRITDCRHANSTRRLIREMQEKYLKLDSPPTDTDSSNDEDWDGSMSSGSESGEEFESMSPSLEQHITTINPRLRGAPSPLVPLVPCPDVFTGAHLLALGFREIKWDDPRAFVDLQNRIGAFFIGPPVARLAWERAVIDAGNELQEARVHFKSPREGAIDTLRSGFEYNARFERPTNIEMDPDNMVTLAQLRYSPSIQTITSFQNAMLKDIAPRLWQSANATIETLLEHDLRLRLPFALANEEPHQPTAFTEVQYRFLIDDSLPRRSSATGASWDVFTSVGHHDSTEGRLILWKDRTIVIFPPGSTFFLPAALMDYSFTAVSSRPFSDQMLISQSFSGPLAEFVANGFQAEADRAPKFATREECAGDRRERAEIEISKYATVDEYDRSTGIYRAY
ncbi:hypothetical protein C8R43DRAFT_1121030 [Mycena crocata]|nr:hypothetical protein C8R43DRAFT_1121030 [Mycena crocata]